MNPIHIHLILNHLPIVAMLLAALLLSASCFVRSRGFHIAAVSVALFAGITAIPAYLSGESAEESLETTQVGESAEQFVEAHEEAAAFALGGGIASALVAGLSLFLAASNNPNRIGGLAKAGAAVVSLAAVLLLVQAGATGGKIAHPELRGGLGSSVNGTATPAAAEGSSDQETETDED